MMPEGLVGAFGKLRARLAKRSGGHG
jgi:hypothetical protein